MATASPNAEASARPLVSVLIPCYNSAPYLRACLDSVLAQTYPNIEIVCVNDGSKDNSLEILREYEREHGIKVIDQENKGQSAAFNVAYAHCRGDYISFFDSDDMLGPDKIEKQMDVVFQNGAVNDVMATCEWARFYNDPAEAVFKPQPLWKTMTPVDWLAQSWHTYEMMHGATWLIPRAVLERSGLWDERTSLINDFEFFCRVMLACREIVFVPGVRTYYRSAVSGALSGQKSRKALESYFLSTSLGTSHLLAVEDSPRTRLACAARWQRMIYEIYPQAPDLVRQAEERIRELGGSDVKPHVGGPLFRTVQKLLGWKAAKRLQLRLYALGYQKRQVQRRVAEARQGAA